MNGGMSAVFSDIRHADLILDQGINFRFIQSSDTTSYAPLLSFSTARDLIKYLQQQPLNHSVMLVSSGMPSILLLENIPFQETNFPAFLPYQYFCHHLKEYSVNIHFTISKELNFFLEHTITDFKVIHESELLLNYWKNHNNVLFAGFSGNVVSLFLKSADGIVAYDQLVYQSAEDVLYFLLYFAKNLQIDPSLAKLMVSGDISLESALCRSLSVYFKALEYVATLPHEASVVEY